VGASWWSHCYAPLVSLTEAMTDLQGESLVRPVPREHTCLVVVRHGTDWRVGFRLTHNKPGPWEMVEFGALYTGAGAATAEMLRRLPLGALLRQARRLVSHPFDSRPVEDPKKIQLVDITELALAPFLVDGRGRRKRTDEDFARLAWEYYVLVTEGDPSPAKTLSDRLGGSAAVWANRISEARRRVLHTSREPAEAGGHLTDKAEALLGHPFEDPEEDQPHEAGEEEGN
jgi:hypothetical protein